jgi:hypothetical protein
LTRRAATTASQKSHTGYIGCILLNTGWDGMTVGWLKCYTGYTAVVELSQEIPWPNPTNIRRGSVPATRKPPLQPLLSRKRRKPFPRGLLTGGLVTTKWKNKKNSQICFIVLVFFFLLLFFSLFAFWPKPHFDKKQQWPWPPWPWPPWPWPPWPWPPVQISAVPLNLLRLGGHVVSFLVVGGGIVGNPPV